jgi:NADPH:quinone reductase-like Zn-dependent oxidoreductase
MGGAAVCSGSFLGGTVELDLTTLYSRCQRVIGVRTGNLESAQAAWGEVGRGFRPVIDRTFAAAQAARAHHYVGGRRERRPRRIAHRRRPLVSVRVAARPNG